MGRIKNSRVLHAQRDEIVDIEESPIVDLLGGDFPKGQAIMLLRQQPVQLVEAFGIARAAIEARNVFIEKLLDLIVGRIELPEHALDKNDLIGSLPAFRARR